MPKVRRIAVSSRVLPREPRQRTGRDQEHPAEPRQRRGDLIGEPGGQMRLRLAGADQLQRQHADPRAAARQCGAHLAARFGAGSVRLLAGLEAWHQARSGGPVPASRPAAPARTGAAARISAASCWVSSDGCGVELIGQHATAAFIGLDRHAALAAPGVGAHQRPPCPLVGAVDRQQLLRRGDHRLRVGLLAQQVLRPAARARSRSRSRSAASQASKVGSMPSRSSSSSPSSSDSAAGWSGVARMTSSTSIQTARPQREVVAVDRPGLSRRPATAPPAAGGFPGVARPAPAPPGRRLHSSSASLPRSTGRGEDSASIASSARVLRPVGRTLSLVNVHASIWPISRRRTSTGSSPAVTWGRGGHALWLADHHGVIHRLVDASAGDLQLCRVAPDRTSAQMDVRSVASRPS